MNNISKVWSIWFGTSVLTTKAYSDFSGMFFASTMVMVTIALVMAVIVTNIFAKKDSPERAPDWCIAIVSRCYPTYFRPNNETGSRAKKTNRKRTNKNRNSSMATCSDQLLLRSSNNFAQMAADTGNWATQKPEVVVETGNGIVQPTHADHVTVGSGNQPPSSGAVGCGHSSCEEHRRELDWERLPDKHDRRRIEMEWKLIAKFTDRVFFWFFLLLSIVVHVALFLQMIPRSNAQWLKHSTSLPHLIGFPFALQLLQCTCILRSNIRNFHIST